MTLTRDQIIDYVYNSEPVIEFYHSAMEIGFWPDFPDDYQIESLAWYLDSAKVNDVKEIDELLIKYKETLNRYIAHIYENRKYPWRVTPGFLCGLALIVKFPESFTVDNLVENGWDKDMASIVIAAANRYGSKCE